MSELRLNTDGHIIKLGADNDVTLTHVHNTGLLLNSTMQLQFNDASQNINAPSATVLDINATDEIELNATLVDVNANVEISGTATTTGVHTFSATPVFPDGSLALADLDIDGGTDIGAAIVDADLFIVDDGAGGTNRKTAASRLKTYIGDNTPSFYAYLGSNQTFATATDTKVTLDTEGWDTDSAFASNKFTVPSNEGGKYLFNFSGKTDLAVDTYAYISVRVNDSTVVRSTQGTVKPNATGNALLNSSVIVALDATDYVELFIYQNSGSDQLAYANYCSLMGCKLIGV